MIGEAVATVAAVWLGVYLLPGIAAASSEAVLMAGGVLAALYLLLRPVARLIIKPLSCLTLGLAGTLLDAGLVMLCAYLLPDQLAVASYPWALALALGINVLRGIAGMIFRKK